MFVLRILNLATQRLAPKGWLLGATLMGTGGHAVANESDDRVSWNLMLRNYFLHNDLRDHPGAGPSYQQEWAQGFIGNLRSGFTDGTLGLGLDAHAFLGIKLDGGRGHASTGLLPVDAQGRGQDYASAGGALKLRIGDHLLRYGEMTVETPEFDTGVMLYSALSPNLLFQTGRFTRFKNQDGSSSYDDFSGYGASTRGAAITLASVRLFDSQDLSAALNASRLKDTWGQDYLNLKAWHGGWTLDGNLYRTREQGAARAGDIDTLAYSVLTSYRLDAQTYTLAYQRIYGDTPFDFVGGDSILSGELSQVRPLQRRPGTLLADPLRPRFLRTGHSRPEPDGTLRQGARDRWLACAGWRRLRTAGSTARHVWWPPLGAGHRPALHRAARRGERPAHEPGHVSHRSNAAQDQRDIDRLYIILEYPIQGLF